MAQIPAQPLRALANFVRDGLASEDALTPDFVAVINELCDLVDKTAQIEEGRVVETFAQTSSLLLDTFQELERRQAAIDPRLVELEDQARNRGGEFAAGVVEALNTYREILDEKSSPPTSRC